ncbi:MAG: putative quinol monooxygenase [Bacteroidota bacterium]
MRKAFLITFSLIPGQEDPFIRSSLENLASSRQEEGNMRFELYQKAKTSEVVMLEVYEDEASMNTHFSTKHFQKWKKETKDHIQSSDFMELTFLG